SGSIGIRICMWISRRELVSLGGSPGCRKSSSTNIRTEYCSLQTPHHMEMKLHNRFSVTSSTRSITAFSRRKTSISIMHRLQSLLRDVGAYMELDCQNKF